MASGAGDIAGEPGANLGGTLSLSTAPLNDKELTLGVEMVAKADPGAGGGEADATPVR
jgi:hypothetical protein